MRNKRSQVTVVIILGMIVFLSLMLAIYLQELYVEATLRPHIYTGISLQAQYDSLNAYVNFCLKDAVEGKNKEDSPILRIAKQGGILANFNSFLEYNPQPDFFTDKINVLCIQTEGKGCVQNILTRQHMEDELNSNIYLNFLHCLNIKEFENKGYIVNYNQSKLRITTNIARDDISFKLYYPLNIYDKANKEITLYLDQWLYKSNIPLGRLYDLAIDIVNEEAAKGYFDKDAWMHDNNAQIIIEKHKPYPNIIYQIRFDKKEKNVPNSLFNKKSSQLIFQFAIKGIDSAGKVYPNNEPGFGCCTISNTCFKNADEQSCKDNKGEYSQDETCVCTQKSNYMNITQFTKDCDYKNQIKEHGSSWCSYDSVAGHALDYVGSRHYLYSCINGEILVEECRDLREELCTEDTLTNSLGSQNNTANSIITANNITKVTKAVCRKNRWQDCMQCANKQCCEDTSARDCIWKDYLKTDKKCLPYVSPGLKFWENDAQQSQICNAASQKTEFLGLKTENAWIDSSAILCYGAGDCGNYRNIADEIAKFGFYNTDGTEQQYVYLDDNMINNAENTIIKLPINTISQPQLASEHELFKISSNYPAAEEIANALKNLDSYKSELFDKYKSEAARRPALSKCNLWQPPQHTDKCPYCTKDSALGKVCSEYKCKSLGKECRFTYNRGIPQCSSPENIDLIPPIIEPDARALPEDYSYIKTDFVPENAPWFKGFAIQPEILPHELISFGITTSEESICKMTYLPESDFNLLPATWFGDTSYKTAHNITIRLPTKIELPENFFKSNNLTSLADLAKLPGFATKRNNLAALKLLDEFKLGNYHLFIKCNDRFGNTNSDEFFISFKIKSSLDDTDAPLILEAVPKNNSIMSRNFEALPLKIYISEPAECKASTVDIGYENMENNFRCPTSEYDITGVAAGSYECNAILPFAERYYIRCTDNPLPTAEFQLTVNSSQPNLTEENEKLVDRAFMTETNAYDAYYLLLPDINTIRKSSLIFNFDKNIQLRFGINSDAACKVSASNEEFDKIIDEIRCTRKEEYNATEENTALDAIEYITDNFTEPFICSHELIILDNKDNNTVFYIKCRDKNATEMLANNQIKRNIAQDSYEYILRRSSGIEITEISPIAQADTLSPKLTVKVTGNVTEDNIKCSYKKADNPITAEYYSMQILNGDNNSFSARLNSLNNFEEYEYDIRCTNKYGDNAVASTRFAVIVN